MIKEKPSTKKGKKPLVPPPKVKRKTKVQVAQEWIDNHSLNKVKEPFFKAEPSDEYVWDKLNPKQELFCELYTSKEFFGNGVQTYIEVYDPDTTKPNWYKTACASASQLLSNIKVYTRINDLLESSGLNDQFADKQLLFLMSQHDDKSNKLWAVREYNKLKWRITEKIEQKTEVSLDLSDADKKRLLALLKLWTK